jgi:hypothetical protein
VALSSMVVRCKFAEMDKRLKILKGKSKSEKAYPAGSSGPYPWKPTRSVQLGNPNRIAASRASSKRSTISLVYGVSRYHFGGKCLADIQDAP